MKETLALVYHRAVSYIQQHRAAVTAGLAGLLTVLIFSVVCCLLKPTTITDGSTVTTVWTFSRDSHAILQSVGIPLGTDDRVVTTSSDGGYILHVLRAFPVTVEADGAVRTVSIADGTVTDVLRKAGLGDNRYRLIEYAADTPVKSGMVVRITAYAFSTRTETTVIPHTTELSYTDAIPAGGRELIRAGADGEQTTVYRDFYDENGKCIKTETALQVVTKEPVTELSRVGSGSLSVAKMPIELDENGHPTTYKEVLTGDACAYYFKKGTGTATGKQCKNGVVAVDPEVIPYGSKLFIIADDGYVYGYAEAVDSGEAVRDRIILVDLFMESYKQTCQFGRRHVSVYILE